jgi:hypothetical protein
MHATKRWLAGWLSLLSVCLTPVAPAAAGPVALSPSDSGTDVRADQLLARMGQAEGDTRRRLAEARTVRDAALATCIGEKLAQIDSSLRSARLKRAVLRKAVLYDDASGAQAAWAELTELEGTAQSMATQATQCVGNEGGDRDGDGIPDQVDREPADTGEDTDGKVVVGSHVVRLAELDQRVDSLKARVLYKSNARLALLHNTVLAGAAAAVAGPSPSSHTADAPHDSTKIIRTADLTLAVYQVEKGLSAVDQIAREVGGYLSLRADQQLTIRVPRERFDEALHRIELLGDVLHRSITAEDVTDDYVDLDMRLRNALLVRTRLEKLLETAAVRDAVEIEKELARVTEDIERLEGKLKLLGDRIAYSTITVSFEPAHEQQVHNRALLPFPWMNTVGLSPLLALPQETKK